jgi:hypothetical protein
VIDLAGIDQVLAFSAGKIDAFEFAAIEGITSDRERLALRAGLFSSIMSSTGYIRAVADLRDHAF